TVMKKKFTIPRLELVRDVFVFACFTFLALIDNHLIIKVLRRVTY
ncbi:MAG TPA: transposase, partial [Parabacteroides merdae]|nr:transposase [Parabacteroides merdae]